MSATDATTADATATPADAADPADTGEIPDSDVIVDTGIVDAGMPLDSGPYQVRIGEIGYEDPSEPSTPLPFDNRDDATATVTLPFPFRFFGVVYPAGSDLVVTTNGTLYFGTGSDSDSNTILPRAAAPFGVIAPLWDDLLVGGGVYLLTTPTTLSLRFFNLSRAGNTDANAVFDVTLRAGNHRIEYAFYSVAPGYDGTIGIGDPTGTGAYQLGCSPTCDPAPGTVVTFIPTDIAQVGPDLIPEGFMPALPASATVTDPAIANPMIQVRNLGNVASPVAILRTYWVPTGDDPRLRTLTYESATVPAVAPGGQVTVGLENGALPWPTTPGTYDLVVTFESPGPQQDEQLDRSNDLIRLGPVNILASSGACAVSTATLPGGLAQMPYSAQLTATGCPNPTWSVSPALPGGLTLSTSGLISGTPAVPSATNLTFTASQSGFTPGTATLPLLIR